MIIGKKSFIAALATTDIKQTVPQPYRNGREAWYLALSVSTEEKKKNKYSQGTRAHREQIIPHF